MKERLGDVEGAPKGDGDSRKVLIAGTMAPGGK
jgi:hypothetical protein